MKYLKNFLSLVLLLSFMLTSGTVLAQQQQMMEQPEPLSPEEVTDEDLQMVSDISKDFEVIQQKTDEKFKVVVEEEGLEYSRFQQIMMAQQNPQLAGQIDMTEEEQSTLETLQPELMQINQQAQQQMMQAIEENGLTLPKFQQLAQAIQTHPEVAERFEEINNTDDDGSEG